MEEDVRQEFKKQEKRFDELMEFLVENMVTKDDLKNFATKDDIANMATKDDLNDLRDELKDEITGVIRRQEEGYENLSLQIQNLKKQTFDDINANTGEIFKIKDELIGIVQNLQIA